MDEEADGVQPAEEAVNQLHENFHNLADMQTRCVA
jgi:hypothetical protein